MTQKNQRNTSISLDQYLKELFEKETPGATQNAFSFAVPPQTRTQAIEADGVLFLQHPELLQKLPYPWRLATTNEVIFEFKMQGDHLNREELELALLRRQAWQRKRAKQDPNDKTQVPVWIASGYLPDWVREERLIETTAPGCYRIEPAFYEVYWIASNELPRRQDLLPFLVTRTGRPLVDLLLWLLETRPKLSKELVETLPMSGQQFDEVVQRVREPDERERMRRARVFSFALAEASGAKDELVAQGKREADLHNMQHLFERRLKRPLEEDELLALQEKLAQLGPDAVSDTVLELAPEKLSAWLKEPAAQ
jgi:hypothetical protein